MKKIIINTIEEDIPFDWEVLKEELQSLDYFDPSDKNQWDDFVDNKISYTFSEEELLAVKDKIIEFEKEHLKELKQSDLEYYLDPVLTTLFNDLEYTMTKDDIINYIIKYES